MNFKVPIYYGSERASTPVKELTPFVKIYGWKNNSSSTFYDVHVSPDNESSNCGHFL